MTHLRGCLLPLLIGLLAGCSDSDPIVPHEPECPAPCRPRPAYLRLDSVVLASPYTNSADGLPLLSPSDVRIAYTITNVSDTTSGPVPFSISGISGFRYDTVPPIAPGQTLRREWRVDYSGLDPFSYTDVDQLRVMLYARTDSASGFSSRTLAKYRVAVPRLYVQAVVDSARVRVGQALSGQYIVGNLSAYAASPPMRLTACLEDWYTGFCKPDDWTTAGAWTIPAIAAKGQAAIGTSLTIPATAAWQDEALTYTLYFCELPASHTDPYLPYDAAHCTPALPLLVRPDYATCNPPLLQPGGSAVLSAYNCGLRPPTTQVVDALPANATALNRFHLVAFEASAGVTYRIGRSAGTQPLRVYDADGVLQGDLDAAADRVRFAQGGRRYIVLYTPQPALTVTLEAQ